MLADQLFQFLGRSEVAEISLHTGHPPCAMVEGTLRRLSAQTLRDTDILGVLAAANGHAYLDHLDERPTWQFEHAVGTITCVAMRDGQGVRAVLRRSGRPAQEPAAGDSRPLRAAPGAKGARPPGAPVRAATQPLSATATGPRTRVAPERAKTAQVSVPPPTREATKRGLAEAAISLPPADPDAGSILTGASEAARVPSRPLRPASQSLDVGPSAAAARVPSKPLRPASQSLDAGRPAAPSRAPLPEFDGDELDDLLRSALEQRATDLHVVAERPALLRVAGDLVASSEPLTAADVERLLLERVPPDRLDELERTGSCDFALEHPAYGRFRANVSRQRTGLKLTARPIGAAIPTLEELGLPDAIRNAMHHHQGLIVITGPTGHGKTTTMAALVGIINRETTHHVITVEDPVEYVHPIARAVISQREVGKHTKSFQAALKGSLREDPDVIVVGELRDTETVRMALSASETGHLVISTMNTPSAAKAIERLIDLFPPGDQPQVRMTLAGGLRLIISQRLLPTSDRKQLCAAAELLPGSTALWALIRDNRTYQITSLQQRGKSLGIVRLDDSLAALVRSGRTTLELARECAEAPGQFDALVTGRPVVAAPAEPPADDGAAGRRGLELGKQVLSRAGKLFGNENK